MDWPYDTFLKPIAKSPQLIKINGKKKPIACGGNNITLTFEARSEKTFSFQLALWDIGSEGCLLPCKFSDYSEIFMIDIL